jgi:hypothetical protein
VEGEFNESPSIVCYGSGGASDYSERYWCSIRECRLPVPSLIEQIDNNASSTAVLHSKLKSLVTDLSGDESFLVAAPK